MVCDWNEIKVVLVVDPCERDIFASTQTSHPNKL